MVRVMYCTLRPVEGSSIPCAFRMSRRGLEIVQPLLLDEDRESIRLASDSIHVEPPDVDPARDRQVALRVEIPGHRRDRHLVGRRRLPPDGADQISSEIED